jgi:hypothetical protein
MESQKILESFDLRERLNKLLSWRLIKRRVENGIEYFYWEYRYDPD